MRLRFLAFLFILFKPPLQLAEAQTPPPASDLGPQSLMRGGAYATGGLDMEAFRGNPAVLALRFGKSGFGGGWQKLPEKASSWQVAITDGRRSVVNGVHFQWWDQDGKSRQSYSLGGAYQTRYGAAGLSLSLLRFSGFENLENNWQFTTNTGILTPAFRGVTLGASLKNTIDRAENTLLPPELALGLRFEASTLTAYFQADRRFSIPDQSWNFSTALGLDLQEHFSLRVGYRFERSHGPAYYSAGIGVSAPRVDLSAFAMRTRGDDSSMGFGFHCLFLF